MACEERTHTHVAKLCHDIRTPVSTIVGFSDLMLAEQLSEVNRQDYIKIIRKNCALLLNLTEKITSLLSSLSGDKSTSAAVTLYSQGYLHFPTPQATYSARARTHILVVEDDDDIRAIMGAYLDYSHIRVDFAADGASAVHKCQDQIYDVIFMDINLPVMDGNQAIKILRSRGYAGAIIALSAYALQHEQNRSLDCGCNEYLCKPVSRDKLLSTINKWAISRPLMTSNSHKTGVDRPTEMRQEKLELEGD